MLLAKILRDCLLSLFANHAQRCRGRFIARSCVMREVQHEDFKTTTVLT